LRTNLRQRNGDRLGERARHGGRLLAVLLGIALRRLQASAVL
jgi:hypothetical protein